MSDTRSKPTIGVVRVLDLDLLSVLPESRRNGDLLTDEHLNEIDLVLVALRDPEQDGRLVDPRREERGATSTGYLALLGDQNLVALPGRRLVDIRVNGSVSMSSNVLDCCLGEN